MKYSKKQISVFALKIWLGAKVIMLGVAACSVAQEVRADGALPAAIPAIIHTA